MPTATAEAPPKIDMVSISASVPLREDAPAVNPLMPLPVVQTWTFYCPDSPDERFVLPNPLTDNGQPMLGRGKRLRFVRGALTTKDPEVAAAIRADRQFNNKYIEANIEKPLVCEDCGMGIRHMKVFQEHIKTHVRRV